VKGEPEIEIDRVERRQVCEPVERLLSSFFRSLDKRDDFIHECLVQNAVRLPDQERQILAEQNVSGKFHVTSLALISSVNCPFLLRICLKINPALDERAIQFNFLRETALVVVVL
jgi:hypothetical protein